MNPIYQPIIKKLLTKATLFYCVIIITLITVVGYVSANGFNQILFSLMFIPMIVYFSRQLFNKNTQSLSAVNPGLVSYPTGPSVPKYPSPAFPSPKPSKTTISGDLVEGEELSDAQVSDINKRLFLKLIGGAGLSTFIFAMFSKSTQAAFFGSVPGPGTVSIKDTAGNKIDPAERQPTDGYEVSEIDDAAFPSYYGFVDKDGNWYIASETSGGAFRYSAGTTNFSTNWTNRASLSYDYFNDAF